MDATTQFTLTEAHQHFAKELNGETWKLLDKPDRSREDSERMLAAAFASYYHWLPAGDPVHGQRGEYLIARVYLALDNLPEALSHARRCLELTGECKSQMRDFDIAFAFEMFARTNAAVGKLDIAREYREKARLAADLISDAEDLDIFLADFNGGNWYGLPG